MSCFLLVTLTGSRSADWALSLLSGGPSEVGYDVRIRTWEPVNLQADARSTDKETTAQLNMGPQRARLVTSVQHRHARELCPRWPSDGLGEAGLASGRKELRGGGYTLEHHSGLDSTKTLGPAGQGLLAWREPAAEGEAARGWSL